MVYCQKFDWKGKYENKNPSYKFLLPFVPGEDTDYTAMDNYRHLSYVRRSKFEQERKLLPVMYNLNGNLVLYWP